MLRDQLNKLFENYDPAIQAIISAVLVLEQEHISMEKPHLKDDVNYIVDLVANKKAKRGNAEDPAE